MVQGNLVEGVEPDAGCPNESNPYFATFLDDYSKLFVVIPMKQKGEVPKVTEHVINRFELQSGKKLRSVRTDRGKDYVLCPLRTPSGAKGRKTRKPPPTRPSKTGRQSDSISSWRRRSERCSRTQGQRVVGGGHSDGQLYSESDPSERARDDPVGSVLRHEAESGAHTDVGSRAIAHVPKQRRRKLDPVSERGVFVGYEPDSKAYRVLRK
ncbi:hypothetical protein KFL_011620020 [Klebsormidium nitens]|uniref:Retroviral polymerase SH3-like domain-containing protein n=1 Tax=Klebsormidium nitens TaxID=105231 RepID=A0A1Y1IPK5_KLENI|nr:hypothetical protein KFL_011620020 [Klebsormidium nitens]|eukprot:GAQ92835.1 hypothetical protein KFL_011620020 [Klebsormidium nitens]